MAEPETSSPEVGKTRLWQITALLYPVEEPTAADAALAAEALTVIQELLRGRSGLPYEGNAVTLSLAQRLAIHHLKRRAGGSNRLAKEAQLAASEGEPLTVCVGTLKKNRVSWYDGERMEISRRYGCGVVFPDSKSISGRVWSTTCPECRSKVRDRSRATVSATRKRLA